jgi:hypothetical protein
LNRFSPLTALCALVSDCDGYTDMEVSARSQLDWLRQFIPLRHGPPSHDVFRNIFLALQPGLLLEIMELWVGELDGKHIDIDGKVSRGVKDSTNGRSTLHILRAWVSDTGLSVVHEVCAEKSNELEALPRLLGKLQLHGATVCPAGVSGAVAVEVVGERLLGRRQPDPAFPCHGAALVRLVGGGAAGADGALRQPGWVPRCRAISAV